MYNGTELLCNTEKLKVTECVSGSERYKRANK